MGSGFFSYGSTRQAAGGGVYYQGLAVEVSVNARSPRWKMRLTLYAFPLFLVHAPLLDNHFGVTNFLITLASMSWM